MKKLLVLVMLLVASTGFAQTMSTANELAPMPVVTSPIYQFLVMATPTLTLSNVGQPVTGLPAGTKGFFVAATTAVAVNYGNVNVVPGYGFPMIATLSPQVFYISPARTPLIYFTPTATGTTPTIRFTPFK